MTGVNDGVGRAGRAARHNARAQSGVGPRPESACVAALRNMPQRDEGVRWFGAWWRALLAELVATALLVWLGLAAAVPLAPATSVPLAHVACAFGFVVAGNALAFGAVSGAHMNPAVTLAALVAGRLPPAAAAGYVLAQCVGAVLGFGALLLTLPVAAPLGCTAPAAAVGELAATALEAALTFPLALACCAAWAAPPDPALPVKLGLLVTGLIYAGGAATGASLNPARSLAPALLHGRWAAHWVYWAGPLGGALLAAALHRWLLTPRAPRLARPEDVPLADKP